MRTDAVHAPFEDYAAADRNIQALKAEYETDVHFQKCYGVMAELFEMHNNLDSLIPKSGFKFLDLGCAPGGFSSFLLDDPRCRTGFGVTLPSTCGGFPMRLRSNCFLLQQADLFEIGPQDLIASQVHICICDAQYMRNNVAWDEKYRGVRCRSKQHGVWALLIKQFWLGLTRLLAGGVLIFRFGWRDPGPDDPATVWYKKMTTRLFSLLRDLFDEVREVKSDYFNALQSSFYVCCTGFDPDKFADRQVAKLFGVNFNYLLSTRIEDSNHLDILAPVDKIRTAEVDQEISDMLDRIEKLRQVHEQSRKWHEQRENERDDPRAVVFLQPAPVMSDEDLINAFSVYGRVKKVDRDGELMVSIQFATVDHARSATTDLRGKGVFSDSIRIWMREEEALHRPSDQWSQDWGSGSQQWKTQANGQPPTQYNGWVGGGASSGAGGSQKASSAPSVDASGDSATEGPSSEHGSAHQVPAGASSASSRRSDRGGGRKAKPVADKASEASQNAAPAKQNGAGEPNGKPSPQNGAPDSQAKTREIMANLLKTR